MKNPKAEQQGQIYFHNIGDYLSREEKLNRISELKSLQGITAASGWTVITPDEHGDWINQRDDSFMEFITIGNKKDKSSKSLFMNYSHGLKSNRDAWTYNSSLLNLNANIKSLIDCYHQELSKIQDLEDFDFDKNIEQSSQKISWTRALKNDFLKERRIDENKSENKIASYRPFTKQWLYYSPQLNELLGQFPRIYPSREVNLTINLVGLGTPKSFSCLITDTIPDVQIFANAQCFPLHLYEEVNQDKQVGSGDLFDESLDLTVTETKYQRKDGISDEGLQHFQTAYPNEQITKEDIFYYTYGLLHSEEYRTQYADNLTKELPRIPCVKKAEDFWAFSKAGRDLAHWHLNYETIEPYKATLDTGTKAYKELLAEDFYVEKMKFVKKGEKGTVIYNKRITIRDIPLEAYEYVVNGKPALEWVMERQGVSTHKDSGIVNDANDWAIETMNNPAYPLELFLRVITVSLETMKIVKALPKLDI